MGTNAGRIALTAAVVCPLTAIGVGMGPGTAWAATPPTISVTLSGTAEWTITWDGTPAASCGLWEEGIPAPLPAGVSGSVSVPLSAGVHPIHVECPDGSGNTSPTITVYAPRGPENDLRTQFSNTTQGMFGS